MKRAGRSRANRSEGWNGGVCIEFVLLANRASFDIFPHKGCKARPPEFEGNQLTGFQVAWVTCCFMVMATSENGLLERGVGGDVDMTFVCEDPFSIQPVRQTRVEGRRNGSVHRLQCLEDKRVRGRGGLDMVGEGCVDEVNKEGGWKKGNSFIL